MIVSWGELLWDLFPDARRLGGAAANVAYHAAMLGDEALLVSRVGSDELGSLALSELEVHGVDTRFVQLDTDAPTGTVHVEVVGGEPRYRIATAVAWDRIEWQHGLEHAFAHASACCFGTLAQRSPIGFDVLERALSFAPTECVRICDLNVRQPFATPHIIDRALSLANVVKLNATEARVLSELYAQPDPVSWLIGERGLQMVALTLGAEGCLLATAHERHRSPGVPLTGADGDAVGAGDAFTAVLAHELPQGTALDEVAARANRYASYVASQPGAMPSPPPWL